MPRSAKLPALYTVGHSTRSADELVELLTAHGVTRLVDIRGIPRSRTHPQFNRDVLPDTLRAANIGYLHLPALGGRRPKSRGVAPEVNAGWQKAPFHNYADYAETPEFAAGLRELLALAAAEPCAIMCAEAVWWRCHRRIVADHVLAHGREVVHIATRQRSEPAKLTPFAVVGTRGRVTYPAAAAGDPQAPVATPRARKNSTKKRTRPSAATR